MTEWTATIHLPGLVIEGNRYELACGRITRLDFDQWYELDGSHEGARSQYEETRPLFWVGKLSAPDIDKARKVAFNTALDLHLLMLLHPLAPALASSGLSSFYLSTARTNFRCWGLAECEWIVFGGARRFTFNESDLALLEDIECLLDEVPTSERPPALRRALDILERTSRPEYQSDHDDLADNLGGFVEAVAACEGLVSLEGDEPELNESLTAAFARRTAALFSPEAATERDMVKQFQEIYSLRSRLIHGRLSAHDFTPEQAAHVASGRRLLRNCCIAYLSKINCK